MITVIIPIYNTEKYLKKCLDSVLTQTYKDIELILVNDGSTDSSGEICKEYEKKDGRVTYYELENGGQGRARNFALDRCNGDWIAFVDSDDYIETDMFEKMISVAEENNAEIAICGWYRDHGFQKRVQPCPQEIQFYEKKELLEAYIKTPYITSSMCNKIYKKNIWEGIRFPEIRAREDATIIYRILANAQKAVHIAEPKYIQYVRPGSTERQGFTMDKMKSVEINEQLKQFVTETYPDLKEIVELLPAKSCVKLMQEILQSFCYRDNKKEYSELYDKLQLELSKDVSALIKESSDYIAFKNVLDNQLLFKTKSYFAGAKILGVDLIKKFMTIALKGKA